MMLTQAAPDVFPAAGLQTQFVGTFAASFVANGVVNPIDVIKSRVQNAAVTVPPVYSGALDCLRKTVAKEGLASLYAGFGPAFVKLAPYTVISLMITEKLSMLYTGKAAI